MDIWNIAKTVGVGIVSTMVPGGAALVSAVNAFLPADQKLPETATGQDMDRAITTLSANAKAELLSKQYDVDIAHIHANASATKAMLIAEASSPHTTRPYVIKHSFHLIALIALGIMFCFVWATIKGDPTVINVIIEAWPVVGVLVVPLIECIRRYFGILAKESADRQNAANGFPLQSGLAALAQKFVKG